MGDDVRKWAEEKAREIVGPAAQHATTVISTITTAILSAHAKGRNEGLEEAAKEAHQALMGGRNAVASIRVLKTKEPT